jgi:hypothetical protein
MVQCCYVVSYMQSAVYAERRKLALYAECHYAECRGAVEGRPSESQG